MIWLPQFGVEIRTSPKVLSTSLKSMAFRLENGKDFEPFKRRGRFMRRGRMVYIHSVYPTEPMGQEEALSARYRIAFVRDPVERFVSFYRNRILTRHRDEAPAWNRLDGTTLARQPSPAELISRLEEYRLLVGSVRHHTEGQVTFLGAQASYYDFIFNARQVSEFEELMSGWTGSVVRLPHQQRSGSRPVELGVDDISRLKEMYHGDYQAYGSWF